MSIRWIVICWASFAGAMTGPGTTYNTPCVALYDPNGDGHIDMRDVQILQNGWQCPGISCNYTYEQEAMVLVEPREDD